MLSFCILYLRFLKWTQAQARNPLQRRSDFIYIETLSTNTYNVQRVGGWGVQGSMAPGSVGKGEVQPHSTLFVIPLQALALTHTLPLNPFQVAWVYRDRSRKIYLHKELGS